MERSFSERKYGRVATVMVLLATSADASLLGSSHAATGGGDPADSIILLGYEVQQERFNIGFTYGHVSGHGHTDREVVNPAFPSSTTTISVSDTVFIWPGTNEMGSGRRVESLVNVRGTLPSFRRVR